MKKVISLLLSIILVISICLYSNANAETNVVYLSADGEIEGIAGTIYTDAASAIAALGSDGGIIYVEGNIVLPTAPQVQAMTGKTIAFYGYNNVADGNVVEFANETKSFLPNAEVNFVFDNITVKHQDGSKTEDWIVPNGGSITFGPNCLYEHGYRADRDQKLKLHIGSYYASKGGTFHFNAPNIEYAEVGSLAGWLEGNTSKFTTSGDFIYNFNAGKFGNIYGGMRNTTTGFATLNGDVFYNFDGATLASGSAFVAGNVQNGIVNGNIFFTINGGDINRTFKYGNNKESDESKASLGNVILTFNADKIKKNGGTIALNITDGSIPKNVGKRFLIINHKEELANNNSVTITVSSETLDYYLEVTGGSVTPVFEQSKSGNVGALLGFKALPDKEGDVPVIEEVMLKQNESGYYILEENSSVQSINFMAEEELISTITLQPGNGSGEPIIATCKRGEEYTIPKCSFTPPEDMVFAGWLADEMKYYTGDVIDINGNISLTAQYVMKDAAECFYVSEDGNDESTGLSSDDAFATLNKAVLAIENSKCESGQIYISGEAEYVNVSSHKKTITYRDGTIVGDVLLSGNTIFEHITVNGNVYTNGNTVDFSKHAIIDEGCVLTLGSKNHKTTQNSAILRGGSFETVCLEDAKNTYLDVCGGNIEMLVLGSENTVCEDFVFKFTSGSIVNVEQGEIPVSGKISIYIDKTELDLSKLELSENTFTFIENSTDVSIQVTHDGTLLIPDEKYIYAKGDTDYFYSVSGQLVVSEGIYKLLETQGEGKEYIPYPKCEGKYFDSWKQVAEGHLRAIFTDIEKIHPYYVSQNGNDEYAGVSIACPFQTLTAAVKAIDGSDGKIIIMDTVYWNESSAQCNVPAYDGTITFEGLSEDSIGTQIIDYSRTTDKNADTASLHVRGNCVFKNISFRAHHWKTLYTNGYDTRFEGKIEYIPGVVGNPSFTVTVAKYNAATVNTSLYLGAKCKVDSILVGHNKASSISGTARVIIDGATVGTITVCGEGASLNNVDIIFVDGALNKLVSDASYTTSKILGDFRFIKSDGLPIDFVNNANIEIGGENIIFVCEKGIKMSLLDEQDLYQILTNNTARAENIANGKIYYSAKGGAIGLPTGSYNITVSDEDYYTNDGDTITVLSDFALDFDQYLYRRNPDNEHLFFTGWWYENSKAGPMSGESVAAGTVLKAGYAEYNPSSTEFGIFDVQIRPEKANSSQGLRFLVNKDNTFDEKFNITEFGAVVLPKEILGSRELVKDGSYTYNEKNYNSAHIVANNILKSTDTGLWYTLCLIGTTPNNYGRLYSARAYANYETANGEHKVLYSDVSYSGYVYKIRNSVPDSTTEKVVFENILRQWEECYMGAGVTKFHSNYYDTAYTVNSSGVDVREITIDSGLGGSEVKISMITDSHIDPKYPGSFEALKKAMECANYAQQIVLCGDNVESVTSTKTMSMFQQLVWDKYPDTIAVLGNHEYFYPDTYMTFDDIKAQVDKVWAHNPDYYSKLVGNKVLVVAADDSRQPVYQDSTYGFTDDKCDKLEKDIQLAREKGYVILFFHHVSITKLDKTYMANGRMYDLVTRNADVIKGCFSGHDHQDYYKELEGSYIDKNGNTVKTKIPCYWLESCREDNYQGNVLFINVK